MENELAVSTSGRSGIPMTDRRGASEGSCKGDAASKSNVTFVIQAGQPNQNAEFVTRQKTIRGSCAPTLSVAHTLTCITKTSTFVHVGQSQFGSHRAWAI